MPLSWPSENNSASSNEQPKKSKNELTVETKTESPSSSQQLKEKRTEMYYHKKCTKNMTKGLTDIRKFEITLEGQLKEIDSLVHDIEALEKRTPALQQKLNSVRKIQTLFQEQIQESRKKMEEYKKYMDEEVCAIVEDQLRKEIKDIETLSNSTRNLFPKKPEPGPKTVTPEAFA